MSMGPFVVADIGGTHARFARVDGDGPRPVLSDPIVFPTNAHAGVADVWPAVLADLGTAPRALCLSVAGPVRDGIARLTNGRWSFDEARLADELELDHVRVINDLEAVGHCAATAGADGFHFLKRGAQPPDRAATLGVVGVGTGLGFARVERFRGGYKVVGTEAGHAGFAPGSPFEAELAAQRLVGGKRASLEDFLSGDGLLLFDGEQGGAATDAVALWRAGIDGSDEAASAAVDRFCAALGGGIGDLALAQGLETVVLAGGVAGHLRNRLESTAFFDRFADKPPMEARMAQVAIAVLDDPEPGLTGAAIVLLQGEGSEGYRRSPGAR